MLFEFPRWLVNIAHIPHLLSGAPGLVIRIFDLHVHIYPGQTSILIGTRRRLPRKGLGMFKFQQYRAKAAEFGERAKGSTGPDESRKLEELQDHHASLADNEQGLADNYQDALHVAEQDRTRGAALADEEEHVLRRLGAAVIMQWNALPTTLQREIFDTAGSVGKLLETAALRGQIARFLHKHKNDAACNKL
jgi:hypothetical protein